jgi:transcriptional regulator with XRE-family HTH domain
MNKRIEPGPSVKLYLAEWRDHRGLSQEKLAERVGTTKASISRWENSERDLTTKVLAGIAKALAVEPVQLFRHPTEPNLDDLLGTASPRLRRKAIAVIKALLSEEGVEMRLETSDTPSKH